MEKWSIIKRGETDKEKDREKEGGIQKAKTLIKVETERK